jgi:uncharacterized protein YkwD
MLSPAMGVSKESSGMRSSAARQAHAGPAFEALESRALLSYSWTSQEVYALELVNRARANPQAEGVLYGVDLTQDLTAGEIANLVPHEPLAFNEFLTTAARKHAKDLADRAFFAHENPDGLDPTARARAEGYTYSAGENIAAGYDNVEAAHRAWLISVGHRKNVLSLYESFDSTFHYDEFGYGLYIPPANTTPYQSYFAQEFGYQGSNPKVYLLGVVYDDRDQNDFYSIAEGVGSVRVDLVQMVAGSPLVATYTTDSAGNYQIVAPAGTFRVVFTNLATGLVKSQTVTIGDENVKVDARLNELTTPVSVSTKAQAGAIISGSSRDDGSTTIVTLEDNGRPIVFQRAGAGEWTVIDLQSWLSSPAPTGQIQTWTDPKDGLTYAAAPSDTKLLLFTRGADGAWSLRDLVAEATSASPIVSDLSVFTSTAGMIHIAGLDASGRLAIYAQSGSRSGADWAWTFTDLSAQLEANGQTTPQFAGDLVSYVTTWNAQNIAGLDSAGKIQVVWWAPGLSSWRTDDLSAITGAPTLTGGLTPYLTGWGGINLAASDQSGKLSVTWWTPGASDQWVTSNLTDLYSGPALDAISISSYVTPWGGLNITGLDGDGNLTVYWWAPGLDAWSVTNLSSYLGNVERPVGSLKGFSSSAGEVSLLGASETNDVLRYSWKPGAEWIVENLSTTATM